ncbi:MAG: PAS domain S-box protein, partial [Sulfuricurvum sp.]|uniref:sensor histidine kinase n=1 Tax=Sulfuricurvum sp. TaxID=2025608 RepID=UPI0025D8626C
SGDGLYWIDTDSNIIHVNQAASEMIGYSYDELTSMSILSLDPNVDQNRWDELLMHLKTGQVVQIESHHKKKNGDLFEVGITGNYFIFDNKGYVFSTVRDLTESKNVLRQLEQSNQKYKEINKNLKKAEEIAKLGNWSLDLITNKLTWSDEIFNIFEIDQNRFEATYEAFVEGIHPEDREMVHDAYLSSLETQEKYKIVHRLLMNDGRIKYVMEQCETTFDKDGKPLNSIGTVQDITEIRNAQLKLVESEQFYRTIVASLDKAIIILENNRIVDCNAVTLSLFETTEEEFIGTDILDSSRIIECSIESFEMHLSNAYQGHTIRDQCTLVLNEKVKTSKVLEITLAMYGNNAEKLILLARDITQKLEEEKFFKLHARQAQMGEMISMIAHQWRQPLAIINAIASRFRLQEMLNDNENTELVESLIKIEQQSLHLSQTISDYRDFFRLDKPLEAIRLSDLIVHTLDLIDHVLKTKGVVVNETIHRPMMVAIYRNEVIQVLITLFKNSLDAFDENNIYNRTISIEIDQDETFGIIVIRDNGGGISEEVISKIFVPYFTTKSYSYGTGLGLYMSKMIIEEHCHGMLEVSSRNDEATITIKLPLYHKTDDMSLI